MAANPSPTQPSTAPPKSKPLVPPEEQFWQRYSPHREALVSGVGSFTVHALLVGFLILAAVFGLFAFLNQENPPIEIGIVGLPGGGGEPGGHVGPPGSNPSSNPGGTPNGEPPREAVNPTQPEPAFQGPRLEDLPRQTVRAVDLPEIAADPDFKQYIDNNNIALAQMSKIGKDARSQLMKGLAAATNSGGTAGGGVGSKPGPGGGAGDGPGGVTGNIRTKRMARWVIVLNNRTGQEYLNQLDSLSAALGLPQPDGQVFILRDLRQRPARGQPEDLARINRIFFVDDSPETCRGLAEALGLPGIPPYVIAFFPEAFEKKLVELEKSFQGLAEDQIQETQFHMVRLGAGLVPRVVSQLPSRRR